MIKDGKAVNVLDDIDALLEVSDISLTASGSSMWPLFKTLKTKVTLTKVTEIKKGKIYLFIHNKTFVLHELIKVKDDSLIFRGYGNVKKEVVNKEAILAEALSFKNKNNKEVLLTNKNFKFKVFIYKLLPRRIVIKLFKRIWQINNY